MNDHESAPLIIAVAPTGARKTKADHPALPMTPAELAATAAACRDAGAAMIHLHVRDAQGGHLLDAAAYRRATEAIRAEVGDGLIVQITTEAVGLYTPAQQMAVVRDARPEAVSLALRELLPAGGDEGAVAAFLAELAVAGTLVQYILYDAADVVRLGELARRGIVPQGQPSVLFVLGRYSLGQQSTPADLLTFLAAWPGTGVAGGAWAVCAFGRMEGACALTAAGLGGHVRVGFENNVQLSDGRFAADNAALVAQVARSAEWMGRRPVGAEAARKLLSAA